MRTTPIAQGPININVSRPAKELTAAAQMDEATRRNAQLPLELRRMAEGELK